MNSVFPRPLAKRAPRQREDRGGGGPRQKAGARSTRPAATVAAEPGLDAAPDLG